MASGGAEDGRGEKDLTQRTQRKSTEATEKRGENPYCSSYKPVFLSFGVVLVDRGSAR